MAINAFNSRCYVKEDGTKDILIAKSYSLCYAVITPWSKSPDPYLNINMVIGIIKETRNTKGIGTRQASH
jgi:hypothetical protein